MRILNVYLFCLGCFITPWLGGQEGSPGLPLPTLSESEVTHFEMLVEGNNRFAFDLYQQMKHDPSNFYLSPYSIVTGLGMATIGAKGNTAIQFQHAFRYSPALLLFIGDLNESLHKSAKTKNAEQVWLANGLWLDKNISILPSYKQTLLRDFRTAVQSIDLANDMSRSIQKMNDWVSKETNGKVRNIVAAQDFTIKSRMVLTTAAYVQGQWSNPFDRKLTKRKPFQFSAQRTFSTDMMQNTSNYLLWKGEKWEMLVVPYEQDTEGAQLAMAILLPKKEVSLAELEKNLNWENWREWKSKLQSQAVALSLPRFRIDRVLDLETVLKGLGLNSIFSEEANFSGMTEEKGIYLNAILHKTSITVDEKGTNTSAVANIKSASSSKKAENPYEFIADRPFVFIIWDQKTDSILFMGRLDRP